MAGIGFELRKMFSESDSIFGNVKAITYSTIISVGPWIITAVSLNILLAIAKYYIVIRSERVLFMATVLYAFIFSQVLVGPWQYLVTRYVSDCIYEKKTHELRGAFIGAMKLLLMISCIVSTIYLYSSPLPIFFKGVSIVLFTLLTGSWICMSFVSVLKNYRFVAYSYIAGNSLAVLLAVFVAKYPIRFEANLPSTNLLLSYTLGILLTFLMLSHHLLSTFKEKGESEFAFVRYLKGYASLFFIGLFYTTGVWVHLFINWFKGDYFILSNTFRVSPLYEVALFYAFLITIPSMVYFVVFLETKFYPDYKKYYANLSYKGTMGEIERSLENLLIILRKEVYYCMELQFFICLSIALISNIFFHYFEMDLYLLELFRLLIFAAFCTIFISIFITILLYLDARMEALFISILFFTTNFVFTYALTSAGEDYTGLGFFLASFITLIVSRIIVLRSFKNLTYTTFYRQNFTKEVGSPLLGKIEVFLNKKGYLPVIVAILILGIFSGCTRYDTKGFNDTTKHNWHTMSIYDVNYFDKTGYNQEGVNERGFNLDGWNIYTDSLYGFYGFDEGGIHKETKGKIDERGFSVEGTHVASVSLYDTGNYDRDGIHKVTKTEYNEKGWTYYGLNKKTQSFFDENGFNMESLDREGYSKTGYDIDGYNRSGWNREGLYLGTGEQTDERGFDINGMNVLTNSKLDERSFNLAGYYKGTKERYDKDGFDVNGVNKETKTYYNSEGWTYYGLNENTKDYYDKNGYNLDGYDIHGYDSNGYDSEGYNERGYNKYGYDLEEYREDGWSRNGRNKFTNSRYDYYGFDVRGINRETGKKYNQFGWDRNGINKETGTRYDKEKYDRDGLDRRGKPRKEDVDRVNADVEIEKWYADDRNIATGTRYDKNGYDINGKDKNGFNREGVYIDD